MPGQVTQPAGAQTSSPLAADYRFVLNRADDGKAVLRLEKRTVTTAPNGTVTETWATVKKVDGTSVEQLNAGWDDTIPWSSGSYKLQHRSSEKAGLSNWFEMSPDPTSRSAIQMHQGNQTAPSSALKGCIGASATFLNDARDALQAAGVLSNKIALQVNNDYGVGFAISAGSTSVDEGQSTTFTISLTGAGGANGVSKDMWVRLDIGKTGPGLATYDKDPTKGDFTIEPANPTPNVKYVTIQPADVHQSTNGPWYDAGVYVLIPKNTNSITYTIKANSEEGVPPEGEEKIDLTIDDYYVIYKDGKPYSDHDADAQPGVLLQGALPSTTVTIKEAGLLTEEHISGGVQGLQRTFSVLKGDLIRYSFDSYSVPDSLQISDGVSPPVGTPGFVSGQSSGAFVAQSDKITVTVVGSSPGTAWLLDLYSPRATGAFAPEISRDAFRMSFAEESSPEHLPAGSLFADAIAEASGVDGRYPVLVDGIVKALGGSAAEEPPMFSLFAASSLSLAQAVAGATLEPALSAGVNVPTGGVATATFSAKAGVLYLARVAGEGAGPGALPDGYLRIFNQGDANPSIEVRDSDLDGAPATFFRGTADTVITLQVGSDVAGKGGAATLEIFDASRLAAPVVFIGKAGTFSAEEGSDAEIVVPVYRIGDLAQAATYRLTIAGHGAAPIGAADLQDGFASVDVTFAPNQSGASASFKVKADALAEPREEALVSFAVGALSAEMIANAQQLGLASSAVVAITETAITTPLVFPIVTVTSAAATEGTPLRFQVKLSEAATQTVVLGYTTIDGVAKSGSRDYVAASGTLAFAPGETAKTISIRTRWDGAAEPAEAFDLKLVSPVGASFSGGGSVLGVVGQIIDKPGAPTVNQDLNGDGAADLLWRHPIGAFTSWHAQGSGFAANVHGSSDVGPGWRLIGTLDFNGDGLSDLFWRNAAGAFTVWSSTGDGFTPNVYADDRVNRSWQVAALGDFNGDGIGDVIWRNRSGLITEWLGDGRGFNANAYSATAPALSGLGGWAIVGTGDFDRNGRADLVWRNSITGQVSIWTSTGVGFTADALTEAGVGPEWALAGIGDFQGDGYSDLIWRRTEGTFGTFTQWRGGPGGFTKNYYDAFGRPGGDWSVSQVGDFDGDGRSDLLFRDTVGTAAVWRSTGDGFAADAQVLRGVGSEWTLAGASGMLERYIPPVRGDATGDGVADLLLRSSSDGSVAVWRIDGAGSTTTSLGSGPVPASWRVAGLIDVDGDATSDIVWQNAEGAISIATARDGALRFDAIVENTIASEFSIAATGDFNGDGLGDLIFRSRLSGTFTEWQSTGQALRANVYDDYASVSLDWGLVGAGDFNGDGKDDLLWRHRTTGAFTQWRSTGDSFQKNAYADDQVGGDWSIQGLGDLDGDGRDDLVWREKSTGVLTVWRSTGTEFVENAMYDATVSTRWILAQVADTNGDGRADLLWRNQDSGDASVWLSTGTDFIRNAGYYSGLPMDWTVEGQPVSFG
jgi:hypothetical protein